MTHPPPQPPEPPLSRRVFVKAATGALAASSLALGSSASAAPRRRAAAATIRVGLIGCGGRGGGAAHDALQASPEVRIAALADVFEDRLESCRDNLRGLGPRSDVDRRHCYVGFDAYRELLDDADVDAVILATPPHFRPMHFAAAVTHGKHVFMEKPVAVDPAGIRTVLAAAKTAGRAGLSVVAGTQRRHEASYRAALKRVHAGAIGRLVSARCYWNMGGLWMKEPRPAWSDMEWQLRNWLYFTWLSGDHIVEQHVHNLDVVNWAMGAHPVRALGVGGRQARTHSNYGHIFDHFAVEYEYPDGQFLLSMCRQMDGCPGRVEEVLHGADGTATLRSGFAVLEGAQPWRFEADNPNPYVQEHRDLHQSIRSGAAVNEATTVAESTLTAIMGRMSAYTGQPVTWEDALQSTLDLSPPEYAFGSLPPVAVAIPGRTPL